MPGRDRDKAAEQPISAAEIRQRAYELWERNHRPEGFEIQFWLMAERELRAERMRRTGESRNAKADPGAAASDHPAK